MRPKWTTSGGGLVMDGLLAVLETVLVLALTYIALTTAASALAGSGMRLTRLRARGLRSMIDYLYRNHVIPLVERLNADYEALRPGEAAPLRAVVQDHSTATRSSKHRQFIIDMTFLPVAQTDEHESDPRLSALDTDSWRSLGMSQDALPPEEFKQRLKQSEIGMAMARALKTDLLRPQDVEIEFDKLTKEFESLGSGATNLFIRKARVWSAVIGFVLAFFLNVDSVNLFSIYLAEPELRAELLTRQEELLKGAEAQDASPVGVQGVASRAELGLEEAAGAAQTLKDRIETIRDSDLLDDLEDGEGKQALIAGLEQSAALAGDATAAFQEAGQIAGQLRGLANTLTAQFPVGWNRFPGCELENGDRRCLLIPTGEDVKLAERLEAAPGQYIKWFFGVLITGFLLGLGVPFWVGVVNNLLRTRKLITDLRAKT